MVVISGDVRAAVDYMQGPLDAKRPGAQMGAEVSFRFVSVKPTGLRCGLYAVVFGWCIPFWMEGLAVWNI